MRFANWHITKRSWIDDLGYVQQSREENGSAVHASGGTLRTWQRTNLIENLAFSKWEAIFKDPMTTAAAIDRLVHHSVILELNIPSYRMEQAKKKKADEA